MDPLNDMCDAFVSINNILQKRKRNSRDSSMEEFSTQKELQIDSSLSFNMNNTNFQTSIMSNIVKNQNENHSLHDESLTEDNFYRAHLYNRNINELPSTRLFHLNRKSHWKKIIDCIFFCFSLLADINAHDIEQLKLIHVYTMQDLLGRYLIHDTPNEFYTFLIKIYQLSEKTASNITNLFYQWTKYHLDGGITDNQQDNLSIWWPFHFIIIIIVKFLKEGEKSVTVSVIHRWKIKIIKLKLWSIYISANWLSRRDKRKRKQKEEEEPITNENNKDIQWDTSSYDNDFSLGGDDDGLAVDNWG